MVCPYAPPMGQDRLPRWGQSNYRADLSTGSGALHDNTGFHILSVTSDYSNHADASSAFSEEVLVKVMLTSRLQPHVGNTRLRRKESGYRQGELSYEELRLTAYLAKHMLVCMGIVRKT